MSRPFLADGTVARLTRWLRLSGLDIEEAGGSDSELLRRARLAGRDILTRCRRLARRDPVRVLLVASDDPEEQLRQVLASTSPGEPLSRCSLCNEPLSAMSAEEAKPLVPPYVHAHHDTFARCPRCGRVYWQGTHVDRIRRRLAAGLGAGRADEQPTPAHPRRGGTAS